MKKIQLLLSAIFYFSFAQGQSLPLQYTIELEIVVPYKKYDNAPAGTILRLDRPKAKEIIETNAKADLRIIAAINGKTKEVIGPPNQNHGKITLYNIILDSLSTLYVKIEDIDEEFISGTNPNDDIAHFHISRDALMAKSTLFFDTLGTTLKIIMVKKIYRAKIGLSTFRPKVPYISNKCKFTWSFDSYSTNPKKINRDKEITWNQVTDAYSKIKGAELIFKIDCKCDDPSLTKEETVKFYFDLHKQTIDTEFGSFDLNLDIKY